MMRVGVVLLASLAAACAEPPSRGCTLIGCDSDARFDVIDTPNMSALAGAQLEMCIAGRCVTAAIPDVMSDGVGFTVSSGDFTLRCIANELSATQFRVAAIVLAIDTLPWRMAGDVYTISLRASDGTLLLTKSWIATEYVELQPNGPGCDPHCVYAHLEPVM